MKYLFFSCHKSLVLALVVLLVTHVHAQKKEAYETMVDGVKVIVQPSNNEIVEIRTIIKGGVQNYTANKQGIESLAMTALTECGTTNDSKNAFKDKLDKVSGSVYASSGMDYASIGMNCIKSDFDVVWPLYADAITVPLFDGKEFARIKEDAITNLKSADSDPDNATDKLARQTAFAGKDYAKSPEGTQAVLGALTAAETKAYYKSILTKSRIFIIVVGEIEQPVLEAHLHKLLANIPQGTPFTLKKQGYQAAQSSFKAVKKDFATNYLEGVAAGPAPGSPDYDAFRLAMRIFNQQHFLEIRTKNGLSYAPGAWFSGGASSSSSIFVTTTDPNKYITVLKSLVSRIKKEGFKESDLKDVKSTFLTRTYSQQETNNAQAEAFAMNEVLHNNWKKAVTLSDDIKSITTKDLDKVFNKYITNISWVYAGDPSKVNAALYTTPAKLPNTPLQTKIPKVKD